MGKWAGIEKEISWNTVGIVKRGSMRDLSQFLNRNKLCQSNHSNYLKL